MLAASDLSEILANLSALNLQPNTAAQILAAVLAPLLRRSETGAERITPVMGRSPSRRRSKPRRSLPQKRKYRRRLGPSEPRARAIEALKAKPDATNAEIGKKLQISPSTVFNARKQLAKEARKEARKASSRSNAGGVQAVQWSLPG
jgi:DNA-binding NarL/FixJ family response regulator